MNKQNILGFMMAMIVLSGTFVGFIGSISQPAAADVGSEGTCIDDAAGVLAGSLAVVGGVAASSTIIGAPAGAGVAGAGLGVTGATISSNINDPCWDSVEQTKLENATREKRQNDSYERGVSAASNVNFYISDNRGGYDSVDEIQPVVGMLYGKLAFNDAYLTGKSESESIQAAQKNTDAYFAAQQKSMGDMYANILADVSGAETAEAEGADIIHIGYIKNDGQVQWTKTDIGDFGFTARNLNISNSNKVDITLSDGSQMSVPGIYAEAINENGDYIRTDKLITPFSDDLIILAEDPNTFENDQLKHQPEKGSKTTAILGEVADVGSKTYDAEKDGFTVSNADVVVDVNGGEDFTNIQDAVQNANNGDVIVVKDGAYSPASVIDIGKNLTVVGINDPKIQPASTSQEIIRVFNGGTLKGVTVKNTDSFDDRIYGVITSGILLDGAGHVDNVTMISNSEGFDVRSEGSSIKNSEVIIKDPAGDTIRVNSDAKNTTIKNVGLVGGSGLIDDGFNTDVTNLVDHNDDIDSYYYAKRHADIYSKGDFQKIWDETKQREANLDERIGSPGTGEKFSNIYRALDQGLISSADLLTSTEQQMLYSNETDIGSEPFIKSLYANAGLQTTQLNHSYVVKFSQGGKFGGATLDKSKTMEADLGFSGDGITKWETGKNYSTDEFESQIYVTYTKEETKLVDGNISVTSSPYSAVYDGEFVITSIIDTDTGEERNETDTDGYTGDGDASYTTPQLYLDELQSLQSATEVLQNEINCLNQDKDYDREQDKCVSTGGGGSLFGGSGGLFGTGIDTASISIGAAGIIVLLAAYRLRSRRT